MKVVWTYLELYIDYSKNNKIGDVQP
jgi:hypothetical protein